MKLAYGNYGMPHTPFKEMVLQIADIGYDGVELCVNARYPTSPGQLTSLERQELKTIIGDSGLAIDKLMVTSIKLLEPNRHARLQHLDQLRQVFDFGAELGLTPIIVSTTIGGRIADWDEQKELVAQCLSEWVEVAQAYQGFIAFEPHVNAIVHNPQRALWLLQTLDQPNLKINFDYSHFELLDISLAEAINQLEPYIISTHVKDVHGRPPDFQFLLPGQGQVNYVDYFQQLQSIGYNGFITAEISAQIFNKLDYNPLAAAQFAYDALSAAFVKIGQ